MPSKTSKTRSESKPPLERVVFFLDACLGRKILPGTLRECGIPVEIHDDHFRERTPDEKWLAIVGRQRWLAVTQDKNIRYRASEKQAVRDYKVAVLIIRAQQADAKEVGNILCANHARIIRYVLGHKHPMMFGITCHGKIRTYDL